MDLVVVESPAKAKTINKYLGRGYEVLASFGHVRDLPAKSGSVDPDANFRMLWEVDPKAQKRLNEIARAVKGAEKLILATDPDREGEAISWHVLEVLKQKKALSRQAVERVVFNAITKQAVTEAMAKPRAIDQALVDAYLARRALDYLVGFTLSPVLWRKLPGARSAGRVQSVALRLVCDRELEIEKFVRREYWSLVATLATPRDETFEARLVGADGKKLQRLDIGSGAQAEAFKQALETAVFRSLRSKRSRSSGIRSRRSPPRRCSRRQAASSALLPRIPCAWRSGSTKASTSAAKPSASSPICAPTACRSPTKRSAPRARVIETDYGARYVPPSPRRYETKAKNAQEAHEAIRPTDLARRPRETKRFLDADQARLYELIWLRTMASQMESAELERTTVDITAKVAEPAPRTARHRDGGEIRRLPRALPGRARRRPRTTRRRAGCREMSAGERLAKRSIAATSILPSRRRATPRLPWSSAWKNSASAGPRPTPRSCRC